MECFGAFLNIDPNRVSRLARLQIIEVIVVGEGGVLCDLDRFLHLPLSLFGDVDFRGSLRGLLGELEVGVTAELAGYPQEGLLEVVVRLGRNVVVLDVWLLSVEEDVLGFDLPVFNVNLVAAEHDGDVLAHAREIAVPDRDVLVRVTGCDVEHNYCRMPVDVIAVAQTSELLLPRGVPAVEHELPEVCVERDGMDLNTECRDVLLLELPALVALDKGRFSCTSIAN